MGSNHTFLDNFDMLSSKRMAAIKSYFMLSVKAINKGSACSVLFLSMTGLFPERRKILEHETQSSTLTFF